MNPKRPTESRIAALISAYADRAPTDADPITTSRLAAARWRRVGPIWVETGPEYRTLAVAVALLALLVTIAVGTFVAGSLWNREGPDELRGDRQGPETILRRGFIGLPPEGATPSTPEHGDLVLGFHGGSTSGQQTSMWVYADGRMIWGDSTGYLEQHLTPEGVELLLSEAISTGLFGHSASFKVDGVGLPCANFVNVRIGERLVHVRYQNCGHSRAGGNVQQATAAQSAELLWLDGRLGDPASWLPASAWQEQQPRAYVPSRFAVCLGEAMNRYPPAAVGLIASAPRLTVDDETPCYGLSTEQARAFVAVVVGVGYRQSNERRLLVFEHPGVNNRSLAIEPILPHGEPTSSDAG